MNARYRILNRLAGGAATAVIGLATLMLAPAALAGSPGHISVSQVGWLWGAGPTGTSQLVRTDKGLSATVRTSELAPGHAYTLWFVVFNHPENCATAPCGPADLFGGQAGGDFLFAAGNVIGGSGKGQFGGHVAVGDTSGSGFFEIGLPGLAVGVTDPRGAEVHLLLHSHGPALTGQALKAQISSFAGGCAIFLGNEFGLAEDPAHVPMVVGECSTVQGALHQPQ